ncbi:g_PROTEIN_RECEP_F1_2 domain-containing protein [Trichonephila inaurata madagascariensis]|uniref:G_PROTEIN_RECEP_F1_2 domain-containing protein n=1 Tax=Trichonephila inaurata madagascariensis TaxID=2747483 RepID=A0A8X6X6R4_9ARAC|nr:g_PROTEIN_RECEP_F1_2 domain-containing protein [Trichonephila inaurata madagascariensis]
MRGLPLDEHRIRHAASRFALRDYNEHPHLDHDCWNLQQSIDCKNLLLNNTSLQLNIQALDDSDKDLDVNGSSTVVPLVSALSPEEDNVKILYQTVVPVMLTACFLSMLFNLVIVFSVKWVRRLSPTLYLSLSLAVADAYASLVIGIGLVINSLLPTVYGMNLGLFNHCYILVLEAFRLGDEQQSLQSRQCGLFLWCSFDILFSSSERWIPVPLLLTSRFPSPCTLSSHNLGAILCSSCPDVRNVHPHVYFGKETPERSVTNPDQQAAAQECQGNHYHSVDSGNLHSRMDARCPVLHPYLFGLPVPYPEIPLWVRIPTGIFINSMIVVKSFVDPIIYVVRMPEIKNAMGAIWRTRCGAHTSLATEFPLHSRTDIHRVTFNVVSRKAKVNGVSPC